MSGARPRVTATARHRATGAAVTLALYRVPDPEKRGIVSLGREGRVTGFVEKPNPRQIATNLISAGIFVVEPRVLPDIPEGEFCDFGHDLFPALLGRRERLYAIKPDAYIQDIGTPERLAKAARDHASGLAGLARQS